jgi:polysaccharide biosynthesis protein PslG
VGLAAVRPGVLDDAQYTGPPDAGYDADWNDFVGRLTARYPRALGIEIWNEPNLNMFFWPAPDPARFTRLLTEAYRAVKAVSARMPVVSGGIAGSPASGVVPLGEGDRPFLAGMYAAGAAGSVPAGGDAGAASP